MFNCHELLIITEGVGTEANFYFRKEGVRVRDIERKKPPIFSDLNDGSIINTKPEVDVQV